MRKSSRKNSEGNTSQICLEIANFLKKTSMTLLLGELDSKSSFGRSQYHNFHMDRSDLDRYVNECAANLVKIFHSSQL